jgi:general secretion pathway protein M
MSRALPPAASRASAVGLLLLVLFSMYMLLVRPYLDAFTESRQRIVDLQYQLARYQAMIDRRDDLNQRIEQLRALPQFTDLLLPETAPNLAAAALENRVKSALAQRQGRMISMQMVPTSQTPQGLMPVTITIDAQGTIETVQSLFHALESGSPLLFLENVALKQSRSSRRRYPGMIAPPLVDLRFNLTGYIRVQEDQGA